MPALRLLPAFLLAASFLAPPAQAQDGAWTLLPSSPEAQYRHDDASFVSPLQGWVVNIHGYIYHTENGGESWALQFEPEGPGTRTSFRTVAFASERLGWAGTLTRTRVLFETRDGGATWTDISERIGGPTALGVCGLWAVDEDVVYGVGAWWGNPRFLRTDDGGVTWESIDMSAHASTLVGIHFFDRERGLILGGTNAELDSARAVVLMTEDGGDTWTRQFVSTLDGEWGWHFNFPTAEVGYASVEHIEGSRPDAKLLKTEDGGRSWRELRIPGSDALQGVGFVTEALGWASGRGTSSMTQDGGETWTPIDAMDGDVNRFQVLNDSLVYAMGHRVYRYGPVRPAGGG